MKRNVLFFILIFTLLNSLLRNPVNAEIIQDDETYYTYSDLMEIDKEVEAFKTSECGEDYEYLCGEDAFYDKLYFTDKKYQLYDGYSRGSLFFDSFNPGQNTAKIIYRDKDDMSWWDNKRYDLTELYLYWLDSSIDIENATVLSEYIDAIKDNTYDPEKVHVLFAGNKPSDFGWLKIEEVSTIPLNSEAGYSKTQKIRFHAVSNGNSYGFFDLPECLNSENYEDGMECTRVYGERRMAVFPIALPVEAPEAVTAEPAEEKIEEPVAEPEPAEEKIEEPVAELVQTEGTIEKAVEELKENKDPEATIVSEKEEPKMSEKTQNLKISTPSQVKLPKNTIIAADLKNSKIEPKSASEKTAQEISLPIASDGKIKSTEEKIFPWQPLIATLFASVGLIWIFFQKK